MEDVETLPAGTYAASRFGGVIYYSPRFWNDASFALSESRNGWGVVVSPERLQALRTYLNGAQLQPGEHTEILASHENEPDKG